MSSIRQATTLLICSLSASADLWIEPRNTLFNDEYFLPRIDPGGLPGYGADHGFSYGAQNEQSTGTSNRPECCSLFYFSFLFFPQEDHIQIKRQT